MYLPLPNFTVAMKSFYTFTNSLFTNYPINLTLSSLKVTDKYFPNLHSLEKERHFALDGTNTRVRYKKKAENRGIQFLLNVIQHFIPGRVWRFHVY
jgi:hypothetical protein